MGPGQREIPAVDASLDAVSDAFPLTPYVRIPFVRRCALFRGSRSSEAVLCNLSVLGAYITFPRSALGDMPELGQTVLIAFLLPGDPVPVEAGAAVTWRNVEEPGSAHGLPPGCALRFVSLRPADHHRIGALIHDYRHADHPRISVPRPESGFVRVPYVQPCVLAGEQGTWDGVLCNVSLLGAYVTVDPIPRAGQRLRLSFPVAGRPVDVDGEVAWVNTEEPQLMDGLPSGCGLRFLEPSDELRARLAALIEDHESVPRPGLE